MGSSCGPDFSPGNAGSQRDHGATVGLDFHPRPFSIRSFRPHLARL